MLRNRSINWRNTTEREQAIERLRALENRQLEKAREIARVLGKPLRERLPDGRMRVLAGIDDDGELVYNVDRNDKAAISTAADQLHLSPFLVDGAGVRVGVWENESPRKTHVEFNDGAISRINLAQSTTIGNHATHVAGTIAAFGVNSRAKGMAYQSIVDAYTTRNDRSEMSSAGAIGPGQHTSKIYVSNHSYGPTYGWKNNGRWYWWKTGTDQNAYDPDFGQYSSTSAAFDGIHYNTPYLLAFWAAGNENTDGPLLGEDCVINGLTRSYDPAVHPGTDGAYSGGFDTLGDQTTAKNLVVVGAVNDAETDNMRDPAKATKASFSSTGPSDDGRIKPDLMGNGVGLYSTLDSSDTAYGNLQGTSMATPNVCGTAALLVDLYRELFSGGAMRSSTLKGLLIHTATDLGNPGPDYTYGWGLVNAAKAAELLQTQADFPDLQSVVEDQVSPAQPLNRYTFAWDGASPIRATLCWTDPPGTGEDTHNDRSPDLVNDLNLKLIAPDGTEYFPFVMPFVGTWTVASMSENATTGVNHTDNVEQVLVESPGPAGVWQAEVSYLGSLIDGFQEYGLLISGASPAGTLVFSEDNYRVDEDAGSLVITVNRLGGKAGAVSVDYNTLEGTALEGLDYAGASGSLNWADGEDGPKTFLVTTVDDSTSESYEETLAITLSNPSGGITIGGVNPAALTIVDDEALMGVTAPTGGEVFNIGAIENITWVSSLGGEVRIELFKQGILYTTIVDRTINDGLFAWNVPTYVSPGSDYRIRISSLGGGGESDQSNQAFSIDGTGIVGELAFNADSYTASEESGTATITVERNGSTAGAVSVDYATSDGTATAGSDYAATSGTLNWADGDSASKTFTVVIANDDDHEDFLESIQLTLTNTFGAAIAAPNPVTLRIQDDDNTPPHVDAGADRIVEWSYLTAVPGLYYGMVEGNIDITTPNPQTVILADVASETENSILPNTTEIYTGNIYDADGQISFTERIDDKSRIWIDDILVISDDAWGARTSTANLNLTPGWHRIEIRISNGDGGSGAFGGEIGIGYDPDGGTAWQTLVDPGDGSLLSALANIPGADTELSGNASDLDGDPLMVEWRLVSGPGIVVFADAGALDTAVSFDAMGRYEFELVVDDGRGPVADTIIIDVLDTAAPTLPITYIDAVEGSAGNTFATGGSLDDTSWMHPDTGFASVDGQWKKRPYATNGTVFHSSTLTDDAQVELTTQITGLADGTYEIWVFFWESSEQNHEWNIATGLASGATTAYSVDGVGDTTAPVLASSLNFYNPPMLTQSVRSLYGVSLGRVTVGDGATIKVFVDSPLAGGLNRTWYDGVGYAPVAEPPSTFEVWAGAGSNPDDDSNQDGVADAIAWVLGAETPSSRIDDLLPVADLAGDSDYFTYTYRRSDAAYNDPTTSIELSYGSDLNSWTTAVHDGKDILITVSDDFYGTGVDQVEVKLHQTLAIEGRLFARLRVLTEP